MGGELMWVFPDLGGGISVYADQWVPTWGPEPTRRQLWLWRLFGWWRRKPRPTKQRTFWMRDGRCYMSPENFSLFRQEVVEMVKDGRL